MLCCEFFSCTYIHIHTHTYTGDLTRAMSTYVLRSEILSGMTPRLCRVRALALARSCDATLEAFRSSAMGDVL